MKKINLLALAIFTTILFKGYAQETRQGKVLGVISIGNQEYATVEDLNNGCRCKTSPYERGKLTLNENVNIKVVNERKIVEKRNFEIFCKDNECEAKTIIEKENIITIIGKHHNDALHNLNGKIDYQQEIVSNMNIDEFLSMAEQDAFNEYKNYTNGSKFYPTEISNDVTEFIEIRKKIISGTPQGLDIQKMKEGLLDLRLAFINNKSIILASSSEKDYNIIVETLSASIIFLEDYNKNSFNSNINNLISEWNREHFFKNTDNSGIPSGLILGVAKGSSKYWFVDTKLDDDDDEIESIAPWIIADLGSAALASLEIAFKEATTRGGTNTSFEEYIISVAWSAIKGSFLGGAVQKVGKWLKWF